MCVCVCVCVYVSVCLVLGAEWKSVQWAGLFKTYAEVFRTTLQEKNLSEICRMQ